MTLTDTSPVLIFASGQRCGSTLLQRYLCSHPDMLIWGEHDGVLNKIFPQFERMHEWNEMFGHQYTTFINEGYNNFIPNMNPPSSHIHSALVTMIRNIWQEPARMHGCKYWGFKEVLYGAETALQFRDLFPEVKIIHLTRNIFECFISLRHEEYIAPEMQPHVPVKQVWTRQRTLDFIESWVQVNKSLLSEPKITPDWVYHLTYEDMIKCPKESMQKLTQWLGIDYAQFDIHVFDHKLYTDRHKGPDPRPKIQRADLSADEIALITTEEILDISEQLHYDMSVG